MIYTDKLQLRRTTPEDLEFVLTAERHEENRPYIGQWSLEEHTAGLTDEDILHLLLTDAAGNSIGYVIVTGLRDPNSSVCLKRIVVHAKERGYGTLLLGLLTDYIFTHTQTHRLWLDVRENNDRAKHVYTGAGFILEGTLRDSVRLGDTFVSMQVMSILRPEYERKKNSIAGAR